MKKVLIGIPILFVFLFIVVIVLVMFDYVYYPLISSKAEKAAEEYLEEKYEEDFVIERSSYSKQLGEKWGGYNIDVHLAKDENFTFNIFVYDHFERMYDDYLEMKWRAELNEQFSSLYTDLYESPENYSYMVNVTFPEDVDKKYNSTNTYNEIFEKEHLNMGKVVFANVFFDSSNKMDGQLEKAFTLIQHLKNQDLEYFSLDIQYYNNDLKEELSAEDKKLDYHDFAHKYFEKRRNTFSFFYDSRREQEKHKLDNIKSAEDLKKYLR